MQAEATTAFTVSSERCVIFQPILLKTELGRPFFPIGSKLIKSAALPSTLGRLDLCVRRHADTPIPLLHLRERGVQNHDLPAVIKFLKIQRTRSDDFGCARVAGIFERPGEDAER